MKAIILDTETTGLPDKGGEACEIAFFSIQVETTKRACKFYLLDKVEPVVKGIENNDWFGDIVHRTFMPLGDFSPQASAVNGFTKEKLKGSPCISTFVFPSEVEYMIGHNVLFDWKILKRPKVKLICTKELAIKYLTKKSGTGTKGLNTLTGLIERYYPEEAKGLIENAHSALQDCKLAYLLLLKILEAAPELDSFEKLAEQCTQGDGTKADVKRPPMVKQDEGTKEYSFTFGKYKGVAFSKIDKASLHNYMQWIVEKSTMNAEFKAWVQGFLKENK